MKTPGDAGNAGTVRQSTCKGLFGAKQCQRSKLPLGNHGLVLGPGFTLQEGTDHVLGADLSGVI